MLDAYIYNRDQLCFNKAIKDVRGVFMKFCDNCAARVSDDAVFCANCGMSLTSDSAPSQNNTQGAPQSSASPAENTSYNTYGDYYQQPYIPTDPFDHTHEFSPEEISENKVFAACVYILGVMGIIIGLLAANSSKYVRFHVRQALKINLLAMVSMILGLVFFWLIIPIIAASVFVIILFVVMIIGFIDAWKGRAKELPIIRNFLK